MTDNPVAKIEEHLKRLEQRNLRLQQETSEIVTRNQQIITALKNFQKESSLVLEK